jgi:hypothetical protein
MRFNTIFAFYVTGLLNPLINYCTMDTILYMFAERQTVYTGSRNWLACFLFLQRGLCLYPCDSIYHCNLARMGPLFLRIIDTVLPQRINISRKETPSGCGLGWSLRSSMDFVSCMAAAPIIWRLVFISFHRFAVTDFTRCLAVVTQC